LATHQDQDFLLKMTPETCVISAWMGDLRFRDPKTGRPLVLSFKSGLGSFRELMPTPWAVWLEFSLNLREMPIFQIVSWM
jgi:hypothetical protein